MRPYRRLALYHIEIALVLSAMMCGLSWATPAPIPDTKGFAEIDVQPTSLTLEVEQGDVATTSFLVINEGSGLLIVYSIEDDAIWLSEEPTNFEVTSGDAENVSVTADASSLSPGIYNQSISIESNDEDESSVVLPVEVTVTESVSVNDPYSDKPNDLRLHMPSPNPFSTTTSVRFHLPTDQAVCLEILNIRGHRVCTLADGVMRAGNHAARWNGSSADGTTVSPGLYLARLSTGRTVLAVPVLRLP